MEKLKMYIGGEWVAASSGRTFTTVNPATEEEVACVPCADEADVDKAVKAAREAFKVWSRMPQAARSKKIFELAEAIRKHLPELAANETLEHGTPQQDAFGACMGASFVCEWNASAARTIMGTHVPMEAGKFSYLQRVPAGVVAAIIPWNLPTIMMAVKLAIVLSVGNTCILKPPSVNSMIGLKFAAIIDEIGLPPGTVNVITGPGESVGKALASHPGVDMIAFTGSSETGKSIMGAAASTVKKCVMELGGKNPVLVMEDADLDECMKVVGGRQFNNSGQHCSGPGRYYVHEKIYDEFLKKYMEIAKSMVVGNPADPKVTMGPLASKTHQKKVEWYIQKGIEEGARLLYGGLEKPAGLEKGFFVMPTILCDANHDMIIAKDEIFGPVAVVIKYTDTDDLVAMANDSDYGLCAHIWTKDMKKGMDMVNNLNVGAAFVNCQTLTDEQPWGTSVKQSGIGKEGGITGLEEFTDLKLVCVRYDL